MKQELEDMLDNLSYADTKTVAAVAQQLKTYYADVEKAAKQRLIDEMESTDAENAMLGDQVIAIVQKRRGGSRETYKVKDLEAYGQWLKGNECVVDGNPAWHESITPTEAAQASAYIGMLTHANGGEMPAGCDVMAARGDTIMCKALPGVGERLIGGDLAPRVQQMMMQQITAGKEEK